MSRQVNLKGQPVELEGPELKVGMKAPDAVLKKNLAEWYKLAEGDGKLRVISVVPSLDTPVCAAQTKRFNEEASRHPDVLFYTVSVDLPPAQARFCGSEGIDQEKLVVLSDHYDCAFGRAWGTLIPSLRIECRALFVVDGSGIIQHAEYVPEVTEHPNYDAALEAVKKAAAK